MNSFSVQRKFFLLFFLYGMLCSFSQSDSVSRFKIRKPLVAGTVGAYSAGSLAYLNVLWYKNYSQSAFHFFDDNSEWLQMDKCGHAFTTYNSGRLIYDAMKWSGFSKNRSLLIGESFGVLYMSAVEIMDGFSQKWGFSWGDEAANLSGSMAFGLQQYFWNEQRIQIKFSFHTSIFPKYRPDELGTNTAQQIVKDYNGQTYWLSVNVASFLNRETKFPKWLNVALGYGATGMVSGKSNQIIYPGNHLGYGNPGSQTSEIIDNNGNIYYFTRYRQFYFSLDIDCTKIKTKSKFLKGVFEIVNCFKIPFPALIFNKYGLSASPLYF